MTAIDVQIRKEGGSNAAAPGKSCRGRVREVWEVRSVGGDVSRRKQNDLRETFEFSRSSDSVRAWAQTTIVSWTSLAKPFSMRLLPT